MLYEEFEQYNKGHIFHMPLAANTSRTDEIISLASYSDKKKYASDISFIGSTYQEKCPFNNAVLFRINEKRFLLTELLMHRLVCMVLIL